MKDDTNISDAEEETQMRGRVNSMRTNIRDTASGIGGTTDPKSRDISINTRELSKNTSFAYKNLTSSQNPSIKDELISQISDSQDYKNFDFLMSPGYLNPHDYHEDA